MGLCETFYSFKYVDVCEDGVIECIKYNLFRRGVFNCHTILATIIRD